MRAVIKGMFALPIVVLAVLFLAFVFYGALEWIKVKHTLSLKKAYSPVFEEEVRYDSYLVYAVLLDESCVERLTGKRVSAVSFFLTNIDEENATSINDVRRCLREYLNAYNKYEGPLKVSFFKIETLTQKTLFSYINENVEETIKEKYFINIYTPKKVALRIVVGYGK